MTLALSSRLKVLALLAVTTAPAAVEAQYGYPYGYRRRRRGGWRNIYLVAIIVPIVFFLAIWLLWFFIFRAIFRRRRNRHQTLPTTSSYPSADGYTNTSYGNGNGNGNTGADSYGNGSAAGYYNNTNEMSEAYTQRPQQAYHPSGQEYAPPAGAPPSGYGGQEGYGNTGYAPPPGAPPK